MSYIVTLNYELKFCLKLINIELDDIHITSTDPKKLPGVIKKIFFHFCIQKNGHWKSKRTD